MFKFLKKGNNCEMSWIWGYLALNKKQIGGANGSGLGLW